MFICKLCGYSTKYKSNLTKHENKKTSCVKNQVYKCQYCDTICTNRKNKYKHQTNCTKNSNMKQQLEELKEEYNKSHQSEDHVFVNNLIKQFKDERMKKVFHLRYFSGEKKMTWVTIGGELNVSAQTAINLHNKGKTIIRKKLKTSTRFADKIL